MNFTPEDNIHSALSATAAIVSMDPHARKDLICYIDALNKAQKAGDGEEMKYIAGAIREVFQQEPIPEDFDLEAWEQRLAEMILCTSCFNVRRNALLRAENLANLNGIAHSSWKLHDGKTEHGLFTTQEVMVVFKDPGSLAL